MAVRVGSLVIVSVIVISHIPIIRVVKPAALHLILDLGSLKDRLETC